MPIHIPGQPADPGLEPASDRFFAKGHAEPNPAVVEAFMHTVVYVDSTGTAYSRQRDGRSIGTLYAHIETRSQKFHPPRDIQPTEIIGQQSHEYWNAIADLVLQEVALGALPGHSSKEWSEYYKSFYANRDAVYRHDPNPPEVTPLRELPDTGIKAILAKPRKAIRNIQESVTDGGVCFYVHTDTPDLKDGEVEEEIDTLVDEMKALIRQELVKVLSDVSTMDAIRRVVEVRQRIHATQVLKAEIDHVEYIRSQAEDPEERKAFIEILNAVVQYLAASDKDLQDVTVESLSSEDAVMRGCIGLYSPESNQWSIKTTARISLPMHYPGSSLRLEWPMIEETLAHELAHHKIAKTVGMDPSKRQHTLSHTMLAAMYLQRIRTFSINPNDFVPTPTVKEPITDSPPIEAGARKKRGWGLFGR